MKIELSEILLTAELADLTGYSVQNIRYHAPYMPAEIARRVGKVWVFHPEAVEWMGGEEGGSVVPDNTGKKGN